jgi:hypothetical protein
MFYDKKMARKIVSMMNIYHEASPWDSIALKYLGLPWITPEESYLEHYGSGGINNVDYERDRAINPTKYLRERRESILRYFMHDDELQSDF